MPSASLTRTELFELVWSIPVKKIAKQFSVSSAAIVRVCENFQIPRPSQGHWARAAWNHPDERPPLPGAPPGLPDLIVFDERPVAVGLATRDDSKPAMPSVHVAERVASPHAVTTHFEEQARRSELDKYGRLLVGLSFYPDLCVRRETLKRSLLLMDALFKALEHRGHVVEMKSVGLPPSPSLMVIVGEAENVHLRIEERLMDTPHKPTADELRKQKEWGWRIKKHDQIPSGALVFKIDSGHWEYRGRKSWFDTKSQRMEDQLGRLILSIEDVARFNHERHVEAETYARIVEQNERRARRTERLEMWRRWLATDLEAMAERWPARLA